MATPFCPHCYSEDIERLEVSKHAHVDYLRCAGCGHVWTVPKPVAPGTPRDITTHSDQTKSS
jgi:uncharacterized OB-fold protein